MFFLVVFNYKYLLSNYLHMKKLFFVLFVNVVNSQILHHQMMSSYIGNYFNNNNIYVSQTIGQMSIGGSFSNNMIIVQQGFQQSPFLFSVINPISKGMVDNSINVHLFPNPFTNGFTVRFDKNIIENLQVLLYDMNGRLILNRHIDVFNHNELFIDSLESIASGTYMINLIGNNFVFKSKVIKVNF